MKLKEVALAGIMIVGVSALGGAGVAQAGSSYCLSNRVCIYGSDNFVTPLGSRGPGGGVENVTSYRNDRMDSWENRTRTNAAWYYNSNGTGTCRTLGLLREDNNINFLDSDKLSSWRTNRGC